MDFEFSFYTGEGVNHDDEHFKGSFEVTKLGSTSTYSIRYRAVRMSDGVCVHEEAGILGVDEHGKQVFDVHMEEMPCTTRHFCIEDSQGRALFKYSGSGMVDGFESELVFEWTDHSFKYLHRWAMQGEVSDKSWCVLSPAQRPS